MYKVLKILLSCFMASFLVFLGIGYATVSLDFFAEQSATGITQEKVFITDFYEHSADGTVNDSSFFKSILTSDVTLNSETSEVTYTVEVFNNADEAYCYVGTLYDHTLGYSNEDIDFKLSDMIEGQWDSSLDHVSVVESKAYLTFKITFFYDGEGTDLSLESVLNFQFMPLKDVQKVTLYYEGNSYMDVFPKDETVATFPDLHFDINATTKINNVARCNLDAVPVFDETTKQISVTGVYSDYYNDDSSVTVNNADNAVKCEIYDSLNSALDDADFEKNSDYTVNNFLVLNDINDTIGGAELPENLEYNVDLNQKYIYVNNGDTMLYMKNASVLNIFNGYKLECTKLVPYLFVVEHEDAVLNINGGYYVHSNYGNIFMPRKGTIISRDADYYSSLGNIFRVGYHPAEEAIASSYNLHVEIIGGSIRTDGANIVHCTSRKTVFFSFVNVDIKAEVDFILCNNNGGDDSQLTEDPSASTYDNVRFYVNGGTIDVKNQEFSTLGSYLFYTNNITYGSYNTEKDMDGDALGELNSTKYHYYAVKNYLTDVDEDWYMVRDVNGDLVYASNGSAIKVGDRISLNSYKDSQYNLGAANTSYTKGTGLKTVDKDTTDSKRPQRWMFLASSDPGYYNIVPYYHPTMMIWVHVASSNIQSTGGNLTNLQSISSLQSAPGGRFRFKSAHDATGNIINSTFAVINKVDAGYPHGVDYGVPFTLDISNSNPMGAGLVIHSYREQTEYDKQLAQYWTLIKHNK